ncbi:hypothetical protein CRX72_04230 [Pantoea sp. BRM17]|nr:hypothetical protein CRX72_04230 [Pantoea sp. BRM17]
MAAGPREAGVSEGTAQRRTGLAQGRGVQSARPGRHSAPGAADGAPLPACKFFILFFLNLVWCALKLSDRTVSHKTHVKGKKRKPPEPTAIKKAQDGGVPPARLLAVSAALPHADGLRGGWARPLAIRAPRRPREFPDLSLRP